MHPNAATVEQETLEESKARGTQDDIRRVIQTTRECAKVNNWQLTSINIWSRARYGSKLGAIGKTIALPIVAAVSAKGKRWSSSSMSSANSANRKASIKWRPTERAKRTATSYSPSPRRRICQHDAPRCDQKAPSPILLLLLVVA